MPAFVHALARFDARVLISRLGAGPDDAGPLPEPDRPRAGNEYVASLVQQYPDRLLGYCFLNPAYTRESLDELEHRLIRQRHLFAGVKLSIQVFCDDPRLDPLMEFCAAHAVPVLYHTWIKVGPDGPGSGNFPNESTPERLVALARRHPKVKFFGGHIGGD